MKQIDFLPQWYKEGKRRQQHVRRQYAMLAVVFLAMVSYNMLSTHRIARASGDLKRLEHNRVEAENIFQEFNSVTGSLNKVRAKAELIGRIDSRIDVAAALAEMSHIVGETVVLSRVEFTAQPFSQDEKDAQASRSGVRPATNKKDASEKGLVGNIRFQITLNGVAVSPADVAALVRRLDDSSYFHRVHASFWRNSKVQVSSGDSPASAKPQTDAVTTGRGESLDVTEFEVVCYLANYEDTESR